MLFCNVASNETMLLYIVSMLFCNVTPNCNGLDCFYVDIPYKKYCTVAVPWYFNVYQATVCSTKRSF